MKRIASIILAAVLSALAFSLPTASRSISSEPAVEAVSGAAYTPQSVDTRDVRLIGVHDAGDLYLPISAVLMSNGFNFAYQDPETDLPTDPVTYPAESRHRYTWCG
ncbi:MAG: hypothetical protein PHR28_13720, partial [candidate division Zixibacteria bacterium]|nr:hypothetical protein [candidate division Zixibacteria bacterium]